MNRKVSYLLMLTLALLAGTALWVTLTQAAPWAAPLQGGSPTMVAYQGEVQVSGAPYTGDGFFKFAIVNAAGTTTYWSNDGTSIDGGEPTAAVALAVSEGIFSVLLGDTTVAGMTQALAADVFSQPDRHLRVWFSTSVSGTFEQLTPDTPITAVPYALQAQEAVDADTVDGLHASDLGTHYQNVVIVAQSGGDYTKVQAAIDSITDAAAGNPYLVWVAPGVYSETVMMKPYVHLQGAGQEATIITSDASSSEVPPTEVTLLLASDTSLRDLTVGNSGTGTNNVALMATAGMTRTLAANVTARAQGNGTSNYAIFLTGSGTGATLQQVTAVAENGSSSNYGLYNILGAAVTLSGGYFTGSGGAAAYGIANVSNATLEAESVTAVAENGSSSNHGLYNFLGAAMTLRGGYFAGSGGTYAYGIANDSNATLEAESVTAVAENGSDENSGLYNSAAAATLRGGFFTARAGDYNRGIYNYNSGATLEAESVTALAENGSGTHYGLLNNILAEATLHGGSFTGRGGTNGRGIGNANGMLEADSVTALGEDGSTNNFGLYHINSATTNITQSVLEGATNSVYRTSGGTLTVSNSRLVGGAVSGPVTCVAVSRDTTFNANGCP